MKKPVLKKKPEVAKGVSIPENKEINMPDPVGKEVVSTEKMEKFLIIVSKKFHLEPEDNYRITSFNDKGNTIKATLANGDFTLTIDIHDCEAQGILCDE